MYLTYTSRMMECRQDGYEEGISIGLERGAYQKALETAKAMYLDKVLIETISKYTNLPLDVVQELAQTKQSAIPLPIPQATSQEPATTHKKSPTYPEGQMGHNKTKLIQFYGRRIASHSISAAQQSLAAFVFSILKTESFLPSFPSHKSTKNPPYTAYTYFPDVPLSLFGS